MNRIDIEIELHRGRADALEWIASIDEDERRKPRTQSEHDPDSWWSDADHFIHTTLIERNFNEMIRGVLSVHSSHARMHRHWAEEGVHDH
jgi:hypothetical protein